jgi:hypothetical protein
MVHPGAGRRHVLVRRVPDPDRAAVHLQQFLRHPHRRRRSGPPANSAAAASACSGFSKLSSPSNSVRRSTSLNPSSSCPRVSRMRSASFIASEHNPWARRRRLSARSVSVRDQQLRGGQRWLARPMRKMPWLIAGCDPRWFGSLAPRTRPAVRPTPHTARAACGSLGR